MKKIFGLLSLGLWLTNLTLGVGGCVYSRGKLDEQLSPEGKEAGATGGATTGGATAGTGGEVIPITGGTTTGGEATGGTTTAGTSTGGTGPTVTSCYQYAFVSDRGSGGAENVYAVSCSGELQKLTTNTDKNTLYNHISFKPDGTMIAYDVLTATPNIYMGSLGDHPEGSLLDVDAGNDGTADYSASSLAWNSDGSAFAFIAKKPNGESVIRVQTGDDASTASDVTDPTTDTIEKVVWSPVHDSNMIVFTQKTADRTWMYAMNRTDKNSLKKIKFPESGSSNYLDLEGNEPSISPDGTKLVYASNVQIAVCDLNLTLDPNLGFYVCDNPRSLTFSGIYGLGVRYSPCWSNDGQIYYSWGTAGVSTGKLYNEISKMSENGSDVTPLPANDNYAEDKNPGCIPPPPGP